ncbi:basement membrane-specific heparan sulfate proteoglycan core protein-like isoform X2 [Betta splendens]|uniref:Basement membrane-specific heparan sulfate proteoglycan core protein-like isoform X2 n=1 Tax=Betta splendens TaxID=158456 RepID=A0A9W2XM27_BETSP|nr:basement membrane-specific heparan sulfate proteoglycan core protein-like isoform X2 [Betta splendens]
MICSLCLSVCCHSSTATVCVDVKMELTLLCVLSLFLLNTKIYGNDGVSYKVSVTKQPSWTQTFSGESITLTCEVHGGGDAQWEYEWRTSSSNQPADKTGKVLMIRADVSHSGDYYCMGRRNHESTQWSNVITLRVTSQNPKARLTAGPSTISAGGSMTLSCSVDGSDGWKYIWYRWTSNTNVTPAADGDNREIRVTQGGKYTCVGRRGEPAFYTQYSEYVTIEITFSNKAAVKRQHDWPEIFKGEEITLTCEIQAGGDTEWEYEWTRGNVRRTADGSKLWVFTASDSSSGDYKCRGRQKTNSYSFTAWSDPLHLTVTASEPKAELRSDKTDIPVGGSVTLSCSVTSSFGWKYYWYRGDKSSEVLITQHGETSVSQEGLYWCRGGRGKPVYYTQYSDSMRINKNDKAQCGLTASPSWLSPGASVALSCEVEPPSAGWRFYWYQTVPDGSHSSYRYELLPGSEHGTEQGSYMLDGHTHTAGYVCRAARGEPVYYTDYSKAAFVWSGDVDPSASLTVSPDTVQHFTRDSVSLSCEGNSTEWRVRRFPEGGFLSSCSNWTTSGSRCDIDTSQSGSAVFWCESGSGHFSNSVNITIHDAGLILMSPVRPVTEGLSVSLSCKLKTGQKASSVFFYHNEQLIQNDSRVELNISAVSKSHEGFYKCWYQGTESPQSWMAVNASKSSNGHIPVMLVVGLVCGVILLLLLLLLSCRFRRSKGSCYIRPTQSGTVWTSNTTPSVSQNQNQPETRIYESVNDSENTGKDVSDVTYSVIELKSFEQNRGQHKPAESPVYSDLKKRPAGRAELQAAVKYYISTRSYIRRCSALRPGQTQRQEKEGQRKTFCCSHR